MSELSRFWRSVRYETTLEKQDFHAGRLFRELLRIPVALRPSLDKNRFKTFQPKGNIFVVIYENHFKHFQPLATALIRQKKPFTIVYLNRDVYERRKGSFENECLINDLTSRWLYAGSVWFQLKAIVQAALLKQNMEGENYPAGRLMQVANRYAKRHYMLRKLFGKMLKGFRGNLILFKAEDYLARTIISVARHTGIKTFAVQHGLIHVHPMFCDLEVESYLVWSDIFKERLQQSGAGCNAVSVGNAAFDQVFEIAGSYCPPNKSTFVLLALPNSGNSHTSKQAICLMLKLCAEATIALPGLQLVIKPHPGDVHENVACFLRSKYPHLCNITLLGRYDSIPFDSCDVVVVNNSTAGMEAAIWEKPLVVVSEHLEDVMVPQYLEERIAVFANSKDKFLEQLNYVLEHSAEFKQSCRRFVNKYLAYHGVSVERILKEINN